MLAQKFMAISSLFLIAGLATPSAQAITLKLNSQGQVEPFRMEREPLWKFIKEYIRISGKKVMIGKPLRQKIKGQATFYLGKAMPLDRFEEIFHHLLYANGYSVVNHGSGTAWKIETIRDARDLELPVYRFENLPSTWRMVSVLVNLKHISADNMARTLRSFMPANSRIIPIGESTLAMTDAGVHILTKKKVFELFDKPEAAEISRQEHEQWLDSHKQRLACEAKKQQIKKLEVGRIVIQKSDILEQKVQQSGGSK